MVKQRIEQTAAYSDNCYEKHEEHEEYSFELTLETCDTVGMSKSCKTVYSRPATENVLDPTVDETRGTSKQPLSADRR